MKFITRALFFRLLSTRALLRTLRRFFKIRGIFAHFNAKCEHFALAIGQKQIIEVWDIWDIWALCARNT